MEYDSYGDWYDNGPGSVSFGINIRREMREYEKKDYFSFSVNDNIGIGTEPPSMKLEIREEDPFQELNQYCLNFALSNDELTDVLKELIKDRYMKTLFDYEKIYKKWPPDSEGTVSDDPEIDQMEDELFKV